LETYEFTGKVLKTFVNGNLVFDEGTFNEQWMGERLQFNR
jgi:dihydroorotase